MGLIEELRRRAKHVVGPLFGIVAVAYFAYHTVHGDRGLLALLQMRERVAEAENRLHTCNGKSSTGTAASNCCTRTASIATCSMNGCASCSDMRGPTISSS